MTPGQIHIRRANAGDAAAIALAHVDSIRSIGPDFYPPGIVEAWASGLTPDVYARAMEGGEAFFVATAMSTVNIPCRAFRRIASTTTRMERPFTSEGQW